MKQITPKFPRNSIAGAAHTTYLCNVWRNLLFSLGPSFVKNSWIYRDIFSGIKAIFGLILLFIIMILSPILCWVMGYIRMRKSRKAFEDIGGTYAGKFEHLNK